jgi:outer membrane protein TolC
MICPYIILAEEPANPNILEVGEAEEEALNTDLSLQAAKLDLEVAKKDLDSAKRIISVGGYYNLQSTNPANPSQGIMANSGGSLDTSNTNAYSKWTLVYTPVGADNKTNIYNLICYPFNLNYEKSVKSVELNLANKYLAYENTRVKLIMDVRNAYAGAVQKEELYQLAIQNLALVKDQFKKSNALYEAGKIPRLDVMDAEQQVKAAESKLVSADLNRRAGLLKLSTLLNNDQLTGTGLKSESLGWAVTDKIDLQATIAQSLKNSPELKTALLSVELAKLQNLMDSFFLLKNINVGVGLYKDPGGVDNSVYTLGFTGPIDDQNFREKKASHKRLEVAEFNLKVATRNKETQVQEAFRNWRIMELNLDPMQESLNIAKERSRIALLKYENGRASESDINQANLLLTQAQENYWNTWLSLQQARESFYQAAAGNPVLKAE